MSSVEIRFARSLGTILTRKNMHRIYDCQTDRPIARCFLSVKDPSVLLWSAWNRSFVACVKVRHVMTRFSAELWRITDRRRCSSLTHTCCSVHQSACVSTILIIRSSYLAWEEWETEAEVMLRRSDWIRVLRLYAIVPLSVENTGQRASTYLDGHEFNQKWNVAVTWW
jgi:hypothetical protein